MQTPPPTQDETQALRRCVRELTALSTLSAVWSRSDLREIAEGLCLVACRSLPAAFAYVRVGGPDGTVAAEIAGTHRGLAPANQTEQLGKTLKPLLTSGSPDRVPTIPNPFGSGTLRLAITPIGHEAGCGVLVAGSEQPDFPSQTDRLLLGVGANQAAIVLQHRRSEEQLRRSERNLADFFDNATLGLHWVGADGIILRANRAELNLLGYSPDEYVGHHIAEFHVDKGVIEDILRRLQAGEELRDYEARLRCKDGSVRHVLINSNVLWEDGRFLHTRCFTRDITDRKRVDEALRESEARKSAMLETALDGIITIDHEGKVIEFNPAAERTFGRRRADVLGREMAELIIPPSLREGHRAGIGRYLATGEGRVLNRRLELTALRSDGSEFPVEVAITPIATNGPPIFTGYIRDISDQKRAENTRRKQTERLQLLWEAAAVLLTADDPDAMLRGLLAKIGPHLGVDTYFNFMVNDSRDALRLASCEGIPVETARTITRLEFGQAICGTVALHRRPIVATHIQQSDDPKAQLVKSFGIRAYACNPLMVGEKLLGTLSFASRSRDQFDADEQDFLQTICRYVTAAYERLRLMNELKEADRRKDEFLATLAHELRNPLAPVRSAVQVLRLKGPDEPELRWGRDVIERQVEHLTRLIDDLLDISRITRNKLELRRQRVELAEVIKGAVESSRPNIEQCGHELTVTLPPEPLYLNGDLVRLAQVFLNLLNNAAKYTDRGGRIWLTTDREGSDVVVRVKDTGVGIPAEKLPRLFEMFFQVDRSLERSQGGLGIGLSLVRRLVELHGGRVEARSAGVGRGSEFIVRLPLLVEKPKPRLPQELNGNDVKKATAARRILVVDDNRDSADSLAMLLRLTGNEVLTGYDGLEGVETAERFQPDVVLLDIGMPRLNGLDACRRIREEAWGRNMVLIALTGWGQEEDRRRTGEAGFDGHMVKPVDPSALVKLLASLPAETCRLNER